MSRTHLSVAAVLGAILSLSASTALAQIPLHFPAMQPAPQPQYRSAKTLRQADRLEGYQMRAPAAEAIAEGIKANSMLTVARRCGRLEASMALKQTQAQYLEVSVAMARRKLDAIKALAPVNAERLQYEQGLAKERNQKRIQDALTRAKQIQQGEWPEVLLDDSFRPLRNELIVAVGDGEQVNWQYAAMIAGQMREQLRGRVRELAQPDYAKALRFLEELKVMGIDSVVGGQS